jgi:hypothetical protein
MPTILQRFNDYQSLSIDNEIGQGYSVAEYENPWVVTNGSLTLTPVITSENFFISNRYVMVISPQTTEDVKITLTGTGLNSLFDIEDDQGVDFVFTGVIKSLKSGYSTSVGFKHDANDISGAGFDWTLPYEPVVKEHKGQEWSIIRSNPLTYPEPFLTIGDPVYPVIEITISNAGLNDIYFTMPNLVWDNGWFANTAVISAAKHMPDFYWEYDKKQTEPQFPFFRFLDVLTYGIHDAMQVYADWYEFDTSELPYDGTKMSPWAISTLTNTENFVEKYHRWTFQAVGYPYLRDLYDTDGEPLITDVQAYRKWQLETSMLGRASGTKNALRDAIQFVLTGDKLVSITPNYLSDIWKIKVITRTSETPDTNTTGDTSLNVLLAAEQARPVGYKIYHETVDAITLTLDNIEFGRLDSAEL